MARGRGALKWALLAICLHRTAAFASALALVGTTTGSEGEAKEWLKTWTGDEAPWLSSLVELPKGYPRIVRSSAYPGLKGRYSVLFGVCAPGNARLLMASLRSVHPNFSQAKLERAPADLERHCPTLLVDVPPAACQASPPLRGKTGNVVHACPLRGGQALAVLEDETHRVLDIWLPPRSIRELPDAAHCEAEPSGPRKGMIRVEQICTWSSQCMLEEHVVYEVSPVGNRLKVKVTARSSPNADERCVR